MRIVLILVLLFLAGIVAFAVFPPRTSLNKFQQKSGQQEPQKSDWKEAGIAIGGSFADAEVVSLDDGRLRMYYSVEPEVPGNKLEVYSALSSDGIKWVKEEGIRKEFATFPDVVKLPDGRWRMYFQNAGAIKSAVSTDGLLWTDEPGVRVDRNEQGFNLADVGAQSTAQLDDGTYIMVYRGTIGKPYKTSEKLPNKDTHLYFWATSKDGLNFEKKGVAFDSRNEILLGATDGAEWVRWDPLELRVYFGSYTGIYHVTFKDGNFSKEVFDFTNNKDKIAKFPPNPPADPTLAKINGQWFMYYGQHEKGIYYATQ